MLAWADSHKRPTPETFGEYLTVFERCFPGLHNSSPEALIRAVQDGMIAKCDFSLERQKRSYRSKLRTAMFWTSISWLAISRKFASIARGAKSQGGYRDALDLADLAIAVFKAAKSPSSSTISESNKQRRRSARKSLSNLPPFWEQTFFASARSDHAYFLGICVMLCTGARPSEIERGVVVTRHSNTALIFRIQSAKDDKKLRSVGWRELVVAVDTPWAVEISKTLANQETVTVTIPAAKKAYDRCVAISHLCWPSPSTNHKNKQIVMPYTFRHRLSSMLKAAGWPDIERARALGHASTRTLSRYGTYNSKTSSGGLPISVRSERNPRPIERVNGIPNKRSRSNGPDFS